MVCWVAVGGRGTLYGAVIGAILVNWGSTRVSEQWPDTWQYVQGLVFIVVVAFIPGGLVGLVKLAAGRFARRRTDSLATTLTPEATTAQEGLVAT
jgi:urea transport system permease protein